MHAQEGYPGENAGYQPSQSVAGSPLTSWVFRTPPPPVSIGDAPPGRPLGTNPHTRTNTGRPERRGAHLPVEMREPPHAELAVVHREHLELVGPQGKWGFRGHIVTQVHTHSAPNCNASITHKKAKRFVALFFASELHRQTRCDGGRSGGYEGSDGLAPLRCQTRKKFNAHCFFVRIHCFIRPRPQHPLNYTLD